jgi:hypothetical protein
LKANFGHVKHVETGIGNFGMKNVCGWWDIFLRKGWSSSVVTCVTPQQFLCLLIGSNIFLMTVWRFLWKGARGQICHIWHVQNWLASALIRGSIHAWLRNNLKIVLICWFLVLIYRIGLYDDRVPQLSVSQNNWMMMVLTAQWLPGQPIIGLLRRQGVDSTMSGAPIIKIGVATHCMKMNDQLVLNVCEMVKMIIWHIFRCKFLYELFEKKNVVWPLQHGTLWILR